MALNAEKLVPIMATLGFAIQQLLQVFFDPLVAIVIGFIKSSQFGGLNGPDGTRMLRGGISDADAKKVLLGLISIIPGLIVTQATTSVRVLSAAGLNGVPGWDVWITALTISAGTEGANSILKLAQYVKDAVKTKTAAPGVIDPENLDA